MTIRLLLIFLPLTLLALPSLADNCENSTAARDAALEYYQQGEVLAAAQHLKAHVQTQINAIEQCDTENINQLHWAISDFTLYAGKLSNSQYCQQAYQWSKVAFSERHYKNQNLASMQAQIFNLTACANNTDIEQALIDDVRYADDKTFRFEQKLSATLTQSNEFDFNLAEVGDDVCTVVDNELYRARLMGIKVNQYRYYYPFQQLKPVEFTSIIDEDDWYGIEQFSDDRISVERSMLRGREIYFVSFDSELEVDVTKDFYYSLIPFRYQDDYFFLTQSPGYSEFNLYALTGGSPQLLCEVSAESIINEKLANLSALQQLESLLLALMGNARTGQVCAGQNSPHNYALKRLQAAFFKAM